MGPAVLELPSLRIDLQRRWVEPLDGVPERLTTLEANVLQHLAANAGRVVSRDELLTAVWGYSASTVSRACDNTIRRLRTKIEDDPSEPEWLLTVYGTGYKLILGAPSEGVVAAPTPPSGERLMLVDRVVELDRHRVVGPEGASVLTSRECDVLRRLAEADGRPVDRDVLLRKVWGSTAGRPLDNAVHRLRRKLERDPTRPRHLLTTSAGYRLDLDAIPGRGPGPTLAPGNLPAEVDRWIGRERELVEVDARIAAGDRLIVLAGPGGSGKTRLAAEVARRWVGRENRPGYWFDLSEVQTPSGVFPTIGRALGLPVTGDDDGARVIAAIAGLGRCVLVLDNLEQLANDPEPFVSLVGGAPDAVVLATSRVLLRLRAERRVEVGPLSAADAAALFVDRAVRPPDEAERADVVALMSELDGLPLAIELAAASTRVLSVGEIRRRSRDHLRVLSSGARDRAERSRSLGASLDWSWDLLSPAARSALAQLSVFRGGFTADAAEAVVDATGWILDLLEELVDASLLRLAPDGARFTLLQVIATYAASRLPDPAPAEIRHGRWFASFGGPEVLARGSSSSEVELRAGLSADLQNLTVAAERAILRGDGPIAGPAALAAWEVVALVGPYRLGADLLRRAHALVPADARVARAAGVALALVGEADEAERMSQRAVAAARASGDRSTEGRALVDLAARASLADRGGAWTLAEDALQLATEAGDRELEARACLELGTAALRRRLLGDARRAHERALGLAIDLGSRRLDAEARRRLAEVGIEDGRLEEAHALASAAVATAIEVGDRRLEAVCWCEVAGAEHALGHVGRSHELNLGALALQRAIGDRLGEATTLYRLGREASALRRLDEAETWIAQAVSLARAIGATALQARLLGSRAVLEGRRGRSPEAERLYREVIALAREREDLRLEGMMRTNLGNLYTDTRRVREAWAQYDAALVAHHLADHRAGIAHTLGQMGMLASGVQDWVRSRELEEEALLLHREIGDVRYAAMMRHNIGKHKLRDGDLAGAIADVDAAIDVHRRTPDGLNLGRALMTRAEIAHVQGDRDAARRYLAEAEPLVVMGMTDKRFALVRGRVEG